MVIKPGISISFYRIFPATEITMDKSLLDNLLQKVIKQESCDVFFRVEEKEIGAHKLVLEVQCQVLYEMAKDWTPDKAPLTLETVTCKHFEELLRVRMREDGHTRVSPAPTFSDFIKFLCHIRTYKLTRTLQKW